MCGAPAEGRTNSRTSGLRSEHRSEDVPSRYRVVLSTLRDGENAYVSVNGKACWGKTNVLGTMGTQECGGGYKEERFRVTGCYVKVEVDVPLTVRVWTSLDGGARDESFAIDNVVVKPLGQGHPVGI